MSKYFSRKLIMTVLFGVGVPIAFHALQVSEGITMFAMGLGAAYLGANAMVAKNGGG